MRAFVLSSQLHRLACIRIVRVSFGQVVEDVKAMPVGYAFVDYIKHTVSCDLLQGHTVSCALCDRALGPCLLLRPCLLAVSAPCRACVPSLVGLGPGLCPFYCRACGRACLAVGLGCVPIFLGFVLGLCTRFLWLLLLPFCGCGPIWLLPGSSLILLF